MNKKTLSLTLLLLLLLSAYIPLTSAHPPNPTYPTHFMIDTDAPALTTDPAWATDTSSKEWIWNVYETLIMCDRDYTLGPYSAGITNSFVPKLATEWLFEQLIPPITDPETGVTWYWRCTFKIRIDNPFTPAFEGVNWHDSDYVSLTPEDVEYSFERLMVQDRTGGPSPAIYGPLLEATGAAPPWVDPLWGVKIDHSVEDNATHVWFNIAQPFVSEIGFVSLLVETWASAVDKLWCQEFGDLNVEIMPSGWYSWDIIWETWHDPPVSFIEGHMMGTGPYKFDYYILGVEWSITQFTDYWDGWPARVSDNPTSPLYNLRLIGNVSRVTWNYFPSWVDRKARFLVGESDQTVLPGIISKAEVDGLLSSSGIRCYYPVGPGGWRHWERDWMRGWYWNQLYPGQYAYHRWKAVTHFGDANNDGAVNILDISIISSSWTGPPQGPVYFLPNADINGGTGGVVCGGSGPVRGIPDGSVDIIDLSLISTYWD